MKKEIKHFNLKNLDEYFNREKSADLPLFYLNIDILDALHDVARLVYVGILSSDEKTDDLIKGESISGFNYDLVAVFMSNAEFLYLVCKFAIDLVGGNPYTGFTLYENPDWDKITKNINRIVNFVIRDYEIPQHFSFTEDFEKQINILRGL